MYNSSFLPPPLDFPGFSQQLQFQKPFLVDKIYSCFFFSFTKWMRLTSVGFWRVLTAPGALRLQLKLKACYRAYNPALYITMHNPESSCQNMTLMTYALTSAFFCRRRHLLPGNIETSLWGIFFPPSTIHIFSPNFSYSCYE